MKSNDIYSGADIVNSLKFYFMLSTYLMSRDHSEYESTQSLKEFIREGSGVWHNIGNKTLSAYYEQAYNSLPAEFLSFMEISTKGDADQVRFMEVR